jgi:hypothetical protein
LGHRNFDRLPFARQAEGVYTIRQMHRARWSLTTLCDACELRLKVSLPVIAKVLGPDAELWGRHPPCMRVRCPGRQTYHAMIPGGSGGPLTADQRMPMLPNAQRSRSIVSTAAGDGRRD